MSSQKTTVISSSLLVRLPDLSNRKGASSDTNGLNVVYCEGRKIILKKSVKVNPALKSAGK